MVHVRKISILILGALGLSLITTIVFGADVSVASVSNLNTNSSHGNVSGVCSIPQETNYHHVMSEQASVGDADNDFYVGCGGLF